MIVLLFLNEMFVLYGKKVEDCQSFQENYLG